MKKRLISMILSCGLLLTALPMMQITVSARGETPDMPTMAELMETIRNQKQQKNTNAYDEAVNFWDDYGDNISEGFEQAEDQWDNVKSIPGFSNSFGGAVKGGDGVFTAAGVATNIMDSASAIHQLTHPQNNPYARHPSLATAYDTLTAWQSMMNWMDMAYGEKDPTRLVPLVTELLGEAKDTWSDTATQTALLDYADHSTLIGTFDITVQNVNDYYTHLFQDVFYPSRDAEWSVEDWWKKSYYDKLNFYAQMVKEGREKEFEWLRDELLNMAPHTGGTVLPNNTEAKKPNIYLYPETETEITVTFEKPEYLTSSIPDYTGAWTVTAAPDGRLTDINGNSYGYLFYEALVKKKAFQTEEGFLVPADKRDETFRRILTSYGFNEQETADFIEYWSDYLKDGADYLMYPMLTDGVDAAMPISFSVRPDSIYRIWFGFAFYDGGEIKTPAVTPIVRDGFTVIEWGGAVLH